MYYVHTYPDTKIRYKASDMQLYIDSNTVYLVRLKARSRESGYAYLSDKLNNTTQIPKSKPNGPILTEYVTL